MNRTVLQAFTSMIGKEGNEESLFTAYRHSDLNIGFRDLLYSPLSIFNTTQLCSYEGLLWEIFDTSI